MPRRWRRRCLPRPNRQVGGDDAWLIVDDTALLRKGCRAAGGAPQYASARGKNANCPTRVAQTLAWGEVPVTAIVGHTAQRFRLRARIP
ncbi:hypothetical protein E3U25_03185 (plasmid) [Paracoccus versutus]|nr:hypothetical protein E3U25_03185 [Paracoccus versutus]